LPGFLLILLSIKFKYAKLQYKIGLQTQTNALFFNKIFDTFFCIVSKILLIAHRMGILAH